MTGSSVFHRTAGPIEAVRAEGCWVTDADGLRYLDAAGGAIVCSVGHGRPEIARVLAEQAATLDYVHGATFTSPVLEDYAADLAPHLPMDQPRLFPVSGGSEATETAVKMAVAWQAACRRPERIRVVSRRRSYHGNTLAALTLSGRPALRAPYEALLGGAPVLPATSESDDPAWHAERLEEVIVAGGDVAGFLAEPIGGAASAGADPPNGYWEAMTEVCRRHQVLVIADEVMTGFGRTGRWFASEHFALSPDVLTAGKGAASGYWPLGLCVASGSVVEAVGEGSFVHGFTFSHHPIGAAVGRAVLRILEDENLVARSEQAGRYLRAGLAEAGLEVVGGRGLLVGVDVGSDSRAVASRCRQRGLLVYPSTETTVLVGPPLTITEPEMDEVVARLALL